MGWAGMFDRVRVGVTVVIVRMRYLQVEMAGLTDTGLQATHPTKQQQSSH